MVDDGRWTIDEARRGLRSVVGRPPFALRQMLFLNHRSHRLLSFSQFIGGQLEDRDLVFSQVIYELRLTHIY